MKDPARRYRMQYVDPKKPGAVQSFEFLNDNLGVAHDHANQICRNEGWTLVKVEYLGRNKGD